MCNRACLSLGSNIEPERCLPAAVAELMRLGRVLDVSHVWQSPPIGRDDQPDFCNAAILLETQKSAEELVDPAGSLREIEARLGRIRDPLDPYGPRTIDIDLSLFNEFAGPVGRKVLPDPDLHSRACVAVPLAELPGVELPGAPGSLREIARSLQLEQRLIPRPDIDAAIAAVLARD